MATQCIMVRSIVVLLALLDTSKCLASVAWAGEDSSLKSPNFNYRMQDILAIKDATNIRSACSAYH